MNEYSFPHFDKGVTMADFDDITYEIDGAAAIITINRPERYNAFRGKTSRN